MFEQLWTLEPDKDADQLHPLVLAYIGDAVHQMVVRQFLIAQKNHRPNHLHRQSVQFVSAKAQARSLDDLMPLLTEEELDVVRRGRNAKSGTVPKNTDVLIYRHSTAFECLIGYLYYKKRFDRLHELLHKAVNERMAAPSGGQK